MSDMLSQVEPMIPALRRYARGLLRDREVADDIVQDCLERVIMNWSRRKDSNARPWVFAILHNLAINRIRHDARRAGVIPLDDLPEENIAVQSAQEQNLFGQDVLAAIDRLPPDYRSILLLVSVEDLTYAEARPSSISRSARLCHACRALANSSGRLLKPDRMAPRSAAPLFGGSNDRQTNH